MDIGMIIFVLSALLSTVTADVYIVTMEGDPIISYQGGENGYEATAVESDERIDTSRYFLDSFSLLLKNGLIHCLLCYYFFQ